MTTFLHGKQGLDLKALPELEAIAFDVLRELARIGMIYYGKDDVDVQTKSDFSPVSEADIAIEERARELLDFQTPDFGFVGEERPAVKRLGDCVVEDAFRPVATLSYADVGQKPFEKTLNMPVLDPLNRDTDAYWILDPIDGTLNFIEKVPLWSTLLALIYKGKPVLAAIVIPCLGEVFVASEGRGARYGKMNGKLQDFKPCFVRKSFDFDEAIINSAPPDSYARRGIENWFSRLHARKGRLRVQGDAFGYTRILLGSVDAMVDPMVSDYDVAALQVLFQETPGAFFSSLHGNQSDNTYSHGNIVAAASESLGLEILDDYWNHLQQSSENKCSHFSSPTFFERYPTLGSLRWSVDGEYYGWCFAMEKAVAEFKLNWPSEYVEDVSIVGEYSYLLKQRLKNGFSDECASIDTCMGLQVRAVVAGGVGLVSTTLPEIRGKVDIVRSALQMALNHSREQKMASHTQILAIRPKVTGHFGNAEWGEIPAFDIFRDAVAEIAKQQKHVTSEGRVVQTTLEQSAKHRFQFFLDGVRQTVSTASTLTRVSVTASREKEKRQGFQRNFSPLLLSSKHISEGHALALDISVREALDLLDAKYVPENISYHYLAIDADLLGLILHEALGHACEGDFIQLGGSGFSEKGRLKDITVAPEWMNIVVDGGLENCGYSPVDYEGTPAVRKTIVRNGRLVEAIHTRQTARALGHVPDGSARPETVFDPSLNRMTSIWVQSQDLHPIADNEKQMPRDFVSPKALQKALVDADILREEKTALYLTGWKGGTATCSNLEFRADVRKVYLLKENAEPVLMRNANFTGIATACFQSAVAAFGPVMCHTYGMCGKDGQHVPTSDGGPMVLLLGESELIRVVGAGDCE